MSLKWIRFGAAAGAGGDYASLFVATGDATVENTTAEQTIIGVGNGSLVVPANSRSVGDRITLIAQGIISSGGNPTIQAKLVLGTTLLAETGAQTLGNLADDHFVLAAESITRSLGVTGSIAIAGSFITPTNHFAFTNTIPVTIDTTIDQTANLTITWGTASASNSITTQIFSFNKIRTP